MKYKSLLSLFLLLFINFGIQFNSYSQCPSNPSFIKLDWSAVNPFGAFSPSTISCKAGLQTIWKMHEATIGTGGEIEAFPGFQMKIPSGLSSTETSILVSVNGVPYSYYGNNAPANVLDWGPLSVAFNILEPYLPGGSSIKIEIFDTRITAQNIPYTIYDYATGTNLISGTTSPSNGNPQTIPLFSITSPTMVWDIDGDVSKIINKNDGSGTFDPSILSVGKHTIHYSFNNNNGCPLQPTSTSQEITITCPNCTAVVGKFNVTGATTVNNSVYNITNGATVNITNSGAVMPTGSHKLSYAFFSCAPTLPLKPSQLLDLTTVPCYLGSDNKSTTSDINNSGFSKTFSTLNKVFILPYTRFNSTPPSAVVNDGTGCYAVGDIIELNYLPTCPTDKTFTKVDWSLAPNAPFISFAPTTFNCNDGIQKIWKNVELSINTNGRIQTSPGFNINLTGLSVTKTSILVSINGIPYSYYGNNAPANVINWGPLTTNFDMIEPFIKGGASVTLEFIDDRVALQNIPYKIYDHITGVITTGSVSVSNGSPQTITFTVVAPTITWNIDGNSSKITNNNDGSGTFDPSSLSAGPHIIKYSYNYNGCSLTAEQSIVINPLVIPTSTNTSICSGTTSTLTATIGSTYNWYDASTGGNKVGSSSAFTTPILTGSKSYWVSSGSGLCESTRSPVNVTVNPNVTPTFILTNNFCINTPVQPLPTTSDNSISGTWAPATINTSTSGSTTYEFTPGINQCGSVISETITVFEKPIAGATPSTSVGKSMLDVDFTNLSTNATKLNWEFGNGETSTTIGNTSSSYTNVGNYTVTLIASNDVCPEDKLIIVITVLPVDPLTISVPNVFTPNNDGVNDHYFIESSNAASFEAIIFNRWGNEIISQNKINEKWDGKSASGKMSENGVYFIKYKIIGLDKSIKEGVASFQLQN